MIGRMLSHYRVVEKIGAGGMGEVYRAHDERLERDVALKVLPKGTLTDEAARKRFRKEALALSKLNHPNIATVFDFDTQDGVDFLVMELVEGVTLSDKVAVGPLREKEITRLGAQLAEGLAAAHERRVVHRDLKPANLRVTPDGRLKILDFGLAKLVRSDVASATATTESFTETQAAAGTLPYMAPEQLRGEQVDARSDLWALGVVLYEMAAGVRPFQGQTGYELSSAILREAPPPVQVPTALRAVIERCLEKEPGERYQRASEVRAALEAVQSEAATAPPQRQRAVARRKRSVSRKRIRALVVLPLMNLSRDPEQEYFADGMTDALITDLAKIRAFRVISRTSAMRYKATDKPLPEIAEELNVDAVVEGSVLRVGERVRITAQLIHAATDEHLWAESYERDLHDVLALQAELARAIAHEIKAKLTRQEKGRLMTRRTVNPAAHEAYMKGRYFWNQRGPGLKKSIKFFERALAEDGNYAPAYAGLADAYALLGFYGYFAPREVMPKAKEAARKASELDPNLAEAHASLGFVCTIFDWDWATAEKEFQRAFKLNPSWSPARYWHTNLLMMRGQFEEAIAEVRHGLEYDPLSVYMQCHLGIVLLFSRRYAEASEQFRKALELDPNFFIARASLGVTYYSQSRLEDSIRELQRAVESSDRNQWPLAWLGVVYAGSGNWRRAGETVTELEQRRHKEYISALHIAEIYAHLGQKDKAFEWLEKAYEERSSLLYLLEWLPSLPVDKLRGEPTFEDLLRRIGVRDGE